MSVSPGINSEFSENGKELSMFDPDSKDSGYCDNGQEEINGVSSPLCLEDDEATILCFSPRQNETPNKNQLLGKKKRLFLSPTESPSVLVAGPLKRLRLFDLESQEPPDSFDELPMGFSEKILIESSDEEPSAYSEEAQHDLVKEAVDKSEEEELIGDFSRSYALPLIRGGAHPDLKSISVHTMRDILEGKFEHLIHSVKIIDSRYPYEFHGGHIQGAVNIYTNEECLNLLNVTAKPREERHILIFHCEFSKERGPNMVRGLRQVDRSKNSRNYPTLTYPEIYILEGGYKRFYETFPEYCDPMAYKHMLHPEHSDEMRFFRKKSKSSDNVLKSCKKTPFVRSTKTVRKFLSNDF